MKRILVVGDPMIDRHWYCKPKGLSPEAPIVNWNVDEIIDKPGGAANVVNNLCALKKINDADIEVTFVGLAPVELTHCVKKDFPLKGLIVSRRKPTIKNRIIFKTPHQQIIRFDEDNNNPVIPEEESEIIRRIAGNTYDVGIISDYAHGGITSDIICQVDESCEIILCDPKGNDPYKYAGCIDILTPNIEELNNLSPATIDCIPIKLKALLGITARKFGNSCIILKQGQEGCFFYKGSCSRENRQYTSYRTNKPVIDPTGAGDTFIATLAFELARESNLNIAITVANQFAGISVTYPNCWIPGENDV
jgi:D-beta-D-heptose 7-phosphate kinase/D-beta-D-heptose 1-phosphate adenosyltransferase